MYRLVEAQIIFRSRKDILSNGAIDAETSSSVAVQVNQNKPQSSNLAQGNKKIVTREYKGIVIEEEVLPKRKRPANYKNTVLEKGDILDSDFDPSSDDNTDESDGDYLPGSEGNKRQF
ncbi:hypothetical protein K7X08_029657 [Anisodus acutangulus]|uniref:Uncharacterized protein n=1 Tax=Anisodus acutangulus TaxID=402998 RepID=A0A9Q1QW58_9SOLA|nr:hypothetical protein K7X08_029657 [Anisodus acutangulus]